LAQLAQVLPRAERDAPELRQGAEHVAAGRPAAPGAAEVRLRAERQAWAQLGAAPREARGAGVREVQGVRPEELQEVRDAARRRAVRHVAARPSARLSAAVLVFRQDRVRLELVQRRSERFARATAC
jgi:hypothetical protein